MGGTLIAVLSAVLSAGLFTFLQFLISRHDSKRGLAKKVDKIERDGVRLQILFMMQFRPEEKEKILEVAEYYFETLKGDWYMTGIFMDWLKSNEITVPGWWKGEEHGRAEN